MRNKSNLKVFSKNYCDELIRRIELGNIVEYLDNSKFPQEVKYAPGDSVIELNPSLSLKIPVSSQEHFDLENSIILYNELKHINETQASDGRLWASLTHLTFWEYMRKRWPAEKFEEEKDDLKDERSTNNKQSNFIIWRYHLKTPNRRRLLRNGLSRLWWYARLTFDENRSDQYELTRVLLAHQDIAQNLLERSLGSNTNVLVAVLEYLQENPKLSREQVREKIKEINLVGGVKNLHLLDKKVIKDIIV